MLLHGKSNMKPLLGVTGGATEEPARPAIVPGKPLNSRLVHKLRNNRMPLGVSFLHPTAFGSDVACIACHASFRDPPSFNEVNLTSHEAIMRGAFSRTNKRAGKPGIPIVVPFDAESSRIYERLTDNRMPPGINPNEESDHPNTSLLMRWIQQGAWCR